MQININMDDFLYLVNGTHADEYMQNDENLQENDDHDILEDVDSEDEENDNDMELDGIEMRDEDKNEQAKITQFITGTCGCCLREGRPCSGDFDCLTLLNYRADMLQLTKEEIDLVLLTAIRISIDDEYLNSKGAIRKNGRCIMHFKAKRICMPTFLMLHAVGARKFYALVKYFKISNSLAPRIHGNSRRLPKNTLSFDDSVRIKHYLINYAVIHGILLPGRYPGFKNTRIRLLESHITKRLIWELYVKSCETVEFKALGYTLFTVLWRKLLPYIIIAKPRTDLCDKCQKNNSLILKTANVDECKKLDKLQAQEEHLYRAERERLVYKRQCKHAKDELTEINTQNSRCCDKTPEFMHLSFDFAQQLHYPAPPDQPGGLFFLTPRKCGLFGICNEGKFQQVNYLIDESVNIGKGPNCIISFLHHYLDNHIQQEKIINMHADNCIGQNKNNFVLQYLLWRIITGRSDKINFSFMIAGHTKFSCDACFGLVKKVTKRTFISSLEDIAKCVHQSSKIALTNIAELVGLENGNLLVPYYDWKAFLNIHFRALPHITMYHHFSFSKIYEIGEISFKEYDDSTECAYNVLKNPEYLPTRDSFPNPIQPIGLSEERKKYLFKEIRPYCKPGTEDLVAPNPV